MEEVVEIHSSKEVVQDEQVEVVDLVEEETCTSMAAPHALEAKAKAKATKSKGGA